jgi:hypothetical protein
MQHVFFVFSMLILLGFALPLHGQSDPNAENSPAKFFITSFWKAIEKLKVLSSEQKYSSFTSQITSAESNLRNIKMKDAAYNTKPLELELEKYKAELQTQRTGQQTAREDMNEATKLYNEIFDEKSIRFQQATLESQAENINKHKAQLLAYDKKVDQFLASNLSSQVIQSNEYRITREAGSVRDKVALLEKEINTTANEGALNLYRDLIGLEAYWRAAVKIYPQVSVAATALQEVKSAISRVGTEEQVQAKFKKLQLEKLNNTRMPAAVMVNAALEADFKKVFNEMGWGETLLRVNLQTKEWSTLYHQITGNIIGRTHKAAISTKLKDGNCILYQFTIIQEYTGAGKYGPSREYSHGVLADKILCEHAK